jgi:hypothetical protein
LADRKTFAQLENIMQESDSTVLLFEEGTSRLISRMTTKELVKAGKLDFKTFLMRKHPKMEFVNNLEDTGIYFMKKELCKVLVEYGKEFSSFNEDFVNFIATNQYNTNLLKLITETSNKKDKEAESQGESEKSVDSLDSDDETHPDYVDNYITRNTGRTLKELPSYIYVSKQYFKKIDKVADYHLANQDFLHNTHLKLNCYKETKNNADRMTYHGLVDTLASGDGRAFAAEANYKQTPTRSKKHIGPVDTSKAGVLSNEVPKRLETPTKEAPSPRVQISAKLVGPSP